MSFSSFFFFFPVPGLQRWNPTSTVAGINLLEWRLRQCWSSGRPWKASIKDTGRPISCFGKVGSVEQGSNFGLSAHFTGFLQHPAVTWVRFFSVPFPVSILLLAEKKKKRRLFRKTGWLNSDWNICLTNKKRDGHIMTPWFTPVITGSVNHHKPRTTYGPLIFCFPTFRANDPSKFSSNTVKEFLSDVISLCGGKH